MWEACIRCNRWGRWCENGTKGCGWNPQLENSALPVLQSSQAGFSNDQTGPSWVAVRSAVSTPKVICSCHVHSCFSSEDITVAYYSGVHILLQLETQEEWWREKREENERQNWFILKAFLLHPTTSIVTLIRFWSRLSLTQWKTLSSLISSVPPNNILIFFVLLFRC